jgi:hypothetical protein
MFVCHTLSLLNAIPGLPSKLIIVSGNEGLTHNQEDAIPGGICLAEAAR